MVKVFAPVTPSVPDSVRAVSVAATVTSAGAALPPLVLSDEDVDESFAVQLVSATPASSAAVAARKGVVRFTWSTFQYVKQSPNPRRVRRERICWEHC